MENPRAGTGETGTKRGPIEPWARVVTHALRGATQERVRGLWSGGAAGQLEGRHGACYHSAT
jgi:hypothetical protein